MGFLDKLLFWRKKPEPPPVPVLTPVEEPQGPPVYWVRVDSLIAALTERHDDLLEDVRGTDSQPLQVKLKARASEVRDWISWIKANQEV